MGFGLHLVGGFPKGILQGRVAPAWPNMRGALPLCTPLEQALRPAPGESLCGAGSPYAPLCRRSALHPGDFPVAGKVTKGAPGAAPLGTRWCEVSALFALAYASRRAGFCHCRSWICHFEMMSQLVLSSPWVLAGRYFLLSIRGTRGLVARLDATLGAIRGIGEGVFLEANRKRSGGNGGDGRRLNPIMSRTRNNLFIKFTASLEFVSG